MFPDNDGMHIARSAMLRSLSEKGIQSGRVLDAMYSVPRHFFVSEALRFSAYNDSSLPIGHGQTISKPSVIAGMVQALNLNGTETVLEIGTGSGYQTAILARLARRVVTMERIPMLSERAMSVLSRFGFKNIDFIKSGDFNDAEGEFDSVIVAAGAEILPVSLFSKLSEGGRLIIPVSDGRSHCINRYVRCFDGSVSVDKIGNATFVPLIEDSAV